MDYTGCTSPDYEFKVTLSWDVSDALTGTGIDFYDASPSNSPSYVAPTARLTICKLPSFPQYNSLFSFPCRCP